MRLLLLEDDVMIGEAVLDLLPSPQQGAFTKEDGEKVVADAGNRITA